MGGVFAGNCPVPADAESYSQKGTSHTPMLVIALACTVATFLTSLLLILTHLRRYRCPKEQRQIVRIAFAPVVFAVVSFFEILSYENAQYIDPIGDVYEAFCLCALLLLYFQFAAPGSTFSEEMFDAIRAAEEGKHKNFDWPRLTWIFVFQYPVVEIFSVIILEATEGANVYCISSLSPKYGHIWVEIIQSIGVGAAVFAIIRYYGHMKNRMKARRGFIKIVSFKLIVGIRFFQAWIFSILVDDNYIKTSDRFSYADLLYGIPNVLTCAEMILFAATFWYAFSSTEYSSIAKPSAHRLPLHKAALDAINPYDLFAGIGRAVTLTLHLQRTGGFSEWNAARKQARAESGGVFGKIGQGFNKLRGRGRVPTVDGSEMLPLPQQSHARSDSGPSDLAYHPTADPEQLYQPPSNSPPSYTDRAYLMAETRSDARTPSPDPAPREWNGSRYERSPSPSSVTRAPVHGRDMI